MTRILEYTTIVLENPAEVFIGSEGLSRTKNVVISSPEQLKENMVLSRIIFASNWNRLYVSWIKLKLGDTR